MSLDTTESLEIKSIAHAIEIIASDAALQVSDDIDCLLSPMMPKQLPSAVWDAHVEALKADLQRTLQQRLGWMLQSACFDANQLLDEQQRIYQQRRLAQAHQAKLEKPRIQEQKKLEQSKESQESLVSTVQAPPAKSKVIPDPAPKEHKVVPVSQNPVRSYANPEPIAASRFHVPRQLELAPEPFAPKSLELETESAPRRKRRRSGVWQTA